MLLAYTKLLKLIENGNITGEAERVNASSIDITLGDVVYVERNMPRNVVDLAKKEVPQMEKVQLNSTGIIIPPGAFVLAQTKEIFNLPNNISAEYKLNSSLARAGLDHLNAGWCDAGWNGSVLTLEFSNTLQHQGLRIRPGMKCGQMVFFQHDEVPDYASYAVKGQYNGDTETQQSKGLNINQPQPGKRTL